MPPYPPPLPITTSPLPPTRRGMSPPLNPRRGQVRLSADGEHCTALHCNDPPLGAAHIDSESAASPPCSFGPLFRRLAPASLAQVHCIAALGLSSIHAGLIRIGIASHSQGHDRPTPPSPPPLPARTSQTLPTPPSFLARVGETLGRRLACTKMQCGSLQCEHSA